jgi:hypothetical protein
MPKAKAAAMRSLEIDETLAEGHASLGAIKTYYDWDWAGAASFSTPFSLTLARWPITGTAYI